MSSKLALLTLVSSALAVPFHALQPRYPAGNTTVVLPTGYGEPTTTIESTTVRTATTVVTQLVTLTRNPSTAAPAPTGYDSDEESTGANGNGNGNGNGQCGGVVTSTIKEQVTVYVTAGAAPAPSAAAPAPVEQQSQPAAAPSFVTLSQVQQDQVAPSSAPEAAAPSSAPEAAAPSSAAAPVPAPVSSEAASAPVYEAPSSSAEEPASYPTESSNTPSPSYGSGKRGLAYNDASLTTCFEDDDKVTWKFNWEAVPRSTSTKLEYVPTMWGLKSDFTDSWDSSVSAAKAAGSTHFMAFNEPDHAEQANMSPADAAVAYRQYMHPVAGDGIRLGSPSVTNGPAPMGLTWLASFMSSCSDCKIDFCQVHWYDSATNIDYFKNHMAEAKEACNGKPIWLTEFGATGSDDQIEAFLEEVMPWMDSQDYIERYAYFMVKDGSLVTGTSKSAIGTTFASA